jgi:hypothetical protein
MPDQATKSSRANAQKGADWRPDGSLSLQASYYGPTDHVVVQLAEDMEAFNRFTAEIVAGLEPETAIERQLAHFYAACQWRANRAAAMEDTLFSVGMMEGVAQKVNTFDAKAQAAVSQALTFRSQPETFEKISQYSASMVSQGAEALGQFKQLQAERRKQTTDHLTDAARLYLYYRMQNRTFDPRENGLNLTVEQIEDYIRRDNLRNDALAAQKVDFDASRVAPRTGSANA